MFVDFPFTLEVRLVDAPSAGVTQEEGHTGFLIHLPSFYGRIKPPRSVSSSIVKSTSVYPRINRILFFGWGGKIRVRVTAPRFELTSKRQKKVSRLPTEPTGRPANNLDDSCCYCFILF